MTNKRDYQNIQNTKNDNKVYRNNKLSQYLNIISDPYPIRHSYSQNHQQIQHSSSSQTLTLNLIQSKITSDVVLDSQDQHKDKRLYDNKQIQKGLLMKLVNQEVAIKDNKKGNNYLDNGKGGQNVTCKLKINQRNLGQISRQQGDCVDTMVFVENKHKINQSIDIFDQRQGLFRYNQSQFHQFFNKKSYIFQQFIKKSHQQQSQQIAYQMQIQYLRKINYLQEIQIQKLRKVLKLNNKNKNGLKKQQLQVKNHSKSCYQIDQNDNNHISNINDKEKY